MQNVSGAENGAEPAENRVSRSGAVSGHPEMLEWEQSMEQEAVEWEQSGERAKSAAQNPLTPNILLI